MNISSQDFDNVIQLYLLREEQLSFYDKEVAARYKTAGGRQKIVHAVNCARQKAEQMCQQFLTLKQLGL
jgi:hypothetical protein